MVLRRVLVQEMLVPMRNIMAFSTAVSANTLSARRLSIERDNYRCQQHRLRPFFVCSHTPPSSPKLPSLNVLPTAVYTAYMARLFVFPPMPPAPQQAIEEALKLSLNFAYIAPVALPHLAPVLHPMLEAIFHVVVAWALLLLGFAARDAYIPEAKPRIVPFLVGALFLTNIVYMPYLCLRTPTSDDTADDVAVNCKDISKAVNVQRRTALLDFAESRSLPLLSAALAAVSVPWALLARAPDFGDLSTRTASFVSLVTSNDILAYSFALDLLVFSIFQWALVDDDARARQWPSNEAKRRAVLAAKYVPFVGLVWYLLARAMQAPLQWTDK